MLTSRQLDLRHLQALCSIVEAGTFSRAAAILGYTQSAISQQIAALERAVGEPLFDRVGGSRRPELTPLGQLLAVEATTLLHAAGELVTAVDRFQTGLAGRVDIGTFQSVSSAVLPTVLTRLRAERPEVDIRLVEDDDVETTVDQLLRGRLDVAFLDRTPPDSLEGIELFVDPFVVVARPQDVGDGPVTAEVLRSSPLIGEQGSACQEMCNLALERLGVPPSFVFRTSDNSAVLAMVRAGMGMALRPRLAVDLADPRLAVRDLDPPVPGRSITVAWPKDRTRSPLARRVVELAVETTAARAEPAAPPGPPPTPGPALLSG